MHCNVCSSPTLIEESVRNGDLMEFYWYCLICHNAKKPHLLKRIGGKRDEKNIRNAPARFRCLCPNSLNCTH